MIAAAVRPVIREALIFYYCWAEADMHPLHQDRPYVTLRLRDLRAERHAKPCYLQAAWRWL